MMTQEKEYQEKEENGAGEGQSLPEGVRPDILNYDDFRRMVPLLDGHPKLVKRLMHWFIMDKCNEVHRRWCYTTGVPFANLLIDKEYKIQKRIDNESVIDRFANEPFIIVSNHPLGALDGILLIDIVGRHRPDFKVMVNMFLNYITAMRPSFIAVDPNHSENPTKKAETMHGIRTAMQHVRAGHPIGFFPAGAVSKVDKTLHISDRAWQPSIIRLIKQLRVPVIPVYFHQHNSTFFNILGMISWHLRTLRLPRELFNKAGKEIRISFGEPVLPEEQDSYDDLEQFGAMLREKTYSLKREYEEK